jgi:hypothetical protein
MKGFVVKNCNMGNAHTRTGSCVMFEGKPAGLIFTREDASFSLDKDAFETEMKAAVYNPTDAMHGAPSRIVPLMYGIANMASSGGDLATAQEGWGGTQFTGLNELREDYTITGGGYCLYKQLYKLNGLSMRVFKVDNSLMAFGTVKSMDGVDKFLGYKVTIGVSRRITGDTPGAILLSLVYSANFQKEDVNVHASQLSEIIEGLSGIQLQKTAAGKAKVVTACSGIDLTDVYKEILEEADFYKDKSGASPTTVAYANGELTLTPAGSYRIVDAFALKYVGIEGYEGEEDYIDIA